MSYGLLYTLPFRDIKEKLLSVTIEQEGYSGSSKELKGQKSPFSVTIDDDDFIYTPIRTSTATLHVFGSDYLQSLFSTDYRMNRVTLYDGSTPVWCGYVKPEVYTQDFRHVKFPLDIECYSAMSVLEFLDFKQQGDTRGFISLWDLIKLCVKESGGLYSAIYIPHTYAKNSAGYSNWENPLSDMMVSQQNFFDEDDEAMTLKEVLENVMKLLNWTCVDWMGELYFVDMDGTEYYKYKADFSSYEQVNSDSIKVQDVGYSGSDHTLDIVGGYNKVVVNCSNYPVGDALPDLDYDNFIKIGEKEQSVPDYTKTITYRPNANNIMMHAFKVVNEDTMQLQIIDVEEEKEIFDQSEVGFVIGAIPQKYDMIEKVDDKPERNDWEFKERVMIGLVRPGDPTHKLIYNEGQETEIIKIIGASSVYQDGAFSVDFNLGVDLSYSDPAAKGYVSDMDFHFMFRIGNNYYHGKSDGSYIWDNNSAQNPDYPNKFVVDWGEEAQQPGSASTLTTFEGSYSLISSRQLNDGLDGMKGFIIKLPGDRILSGELELIIYAPRVKIFHSTFTSPDAIYLEGFSLEYKKTGDSEEDTDRIYENVINEAYINPLDDIELNISSYNNDGACYSKVLLGDVYLTDNLYNGITNEFIRPEDFLIRRIINHYESTKFKLSLDLKRGNIKPYTKITDDNTQGKEYLCIGGEIDYKLNKFACILLEHERGTSN